MTRTSLMPFVRRHLTETAQIIRPVKTPNGRGGFTVTRTVIWEGKCAVRFPTFPRELEGAVFEQGRAVAQFSFDGTDVPKITMADVIHWDGVDWEVQGHNHQPTERITLRVTAWRTLT